MLDRGQDQDWFSSNEIIVDAVLAGLGLYLFAVHLFSARRPLLRPLLFRDRNFLSGLVLMFAVGTLLVSSMALMTPWLQVMSDYPVQTAGMIMAPRGLGNFTAIMLSGRLSNRIDPRYLAGTGLILLCVSFYIMTGWTPDVSQRAIVLTIILQGFGLGLVFMPVQILAFATLAPALRTEGAALFALLREPISMLPASITAAINTFVSLERLQDFLGVGRGALPIL